MFKFKKVCALLCSGMCVLGTNAGANEGYKVDSKGVLRMKKKSDLSKPVGLAYQTKTMDMDDFINKRSEQAKEDQRKGWIVGGESIFCGARVGNRTKRAEAEGRLSVLNNPEVIKNAKESNSDFFRRESKSKKIHSNLLYAGRWVSPLMLDIAGLVGTMCIYGSAINKKLSEIVGVIEKYLNDRIKEMSTSNDEKNENLSQIQNLNKNLLLGNLKDSLEVLKGVNQDAKFEYVKSFIISLVTGYSRLDDARKEVLSVINEIIRAGRFASGAVFGVSLASAAVSASILNYYSQKLQGESDEFLGIGEEIESKRGGDGVLKAVISKNTKTVKKRRRTLNQNKKSPYKKRIKMGTRKVPKGAL